MTRAALLLAAAMLTAAMASPRPSPRPMPDPDQGAALMIDATRVDIAPPPGGRARLLSAHVLRSPDPLFGGLSGLSVGGDGATATVVGDRGRLFTWRLTREGGVITGIADARSMPLRDTLGRGLRTAQRDAEALAVSGADLFVAFEGEHRVWRYPGGGPRARALPDVPGVARLSANSGVEALAVDAGGALHAIPERSGALDRPFPVWRLAPGEASWSIGAWPRRPPHLVTGADIGPDGMLYVVERDFSLLGGWSMRLSRADLADWPGLRPETLLTWSRGGIDNMEAVSLWRDAAGVTRVVMLSDDNFHPLQRTLLLEFALE